jgi:hypothetical protein
LIAVIGKEGPWREQLAKNYHKMPAQDKMRLGLLAEGGGPSCNGSVVDAARLLHEVTQMCLIFLLLCCGGAVRLHSSRRSSRGRSGGISGTAEQEGEDRGG